MLRSENRPYRSLLETAESKLAASFACQKFVTTWMAEYRGICVSTNVNIISLAK